MTTEKHKSQRSTPRLFGQSVDANGNVLGAPIEVRFAHVFAQKKRTHSAAKEPLDKPRYDCNVLVPKLHHDAPQCPNYRALEAHCMEAAIKAWGSFPQGGKWPIQDGDVPHAQKLKPGQAPLTPEQIAVRNKWRTGCWVIEVTNYTETGPGVCVFQNGKEVQIPAQVVNGQSMYKSGDYGFVFLNAYTFHNKTFGVNFGFEGLGFTRPGEAIGSTGSRSAAQMFGSVAGMAPSGAPAMPGAGAPLPAGGYAPPPLPGAPPLAPAAPGPALPTSATVTAPPVAGPSFAPPPPPAAPAYAPPAYAPSPASPAPAPSAPAMTAYPSSAPPAPGLPPFPGR